MDRDPLFTAHFRGILKDRGVEPLRLPARSPNLNAFAERFVLTVKSECLSRIVPLSERHLRYVVSEFANTECRLRYGRRLLEVADFAGEIDLPGEATRLIALIERAGIDSPRNQGAARERQEKRDELRDFLRSRRDEVRQALRCMDDGGDCSDEVATGLHCEWQRLRVGAQSFELCNQRLSWHEAKAACDEKGLVLASIKSARASKAIGARAGSLNKRRWWIGASDLHAESKFVWQDGSSVSFSTWAKSQPDDKHCGQDCVALGSKGRWADAHCEQHLPFVCGRP